MTCACGSSRVAHLGAKCSDLCSVAMGKEEHVGYVPKDMGIGGEDYVEFTWCLNCGRIQGNWPVKACELER